MLDQETMDRLKRLEKQVAWMWQHMDLPAMPPDPAEVLKQQLRQAEAEVARLRLEAGK